MTSIGTVSGTDYFVSTSGSNSDTGLSLEHAWKNPSYAAEQVKAGDTIYLLEGTWTKEKIRFLNTGAKGNPITLTAYSGRPILDGISENEIAIDLRDESFSMSNHYINITGIEIKRYNHGIYVESAHHINISDVKIWNMKTTAITFSDCQYCELRNSDIHDTNWNTIQICTKWDPTHHIKIINNSIHDNPGISGNIGHGLIDLFNVHDTGNKSISDVEISGNHIYEAWQAAFFTHGLDNYHMYRIDIKDNIINDTYGVLVCYLEDSVIGGNKIYDNHWGFYSVPSARTNDNVQFINNEVLPGTSHEYSIVSHRNLDNDPIVKGGNCSYFEAWDGTTTLIIENNDKESFTVLTKYNGKIIVRYTDGRSFTEDGKGEVKCGSGYVEYRTVGDEKVHIQVTGNSNITPTPISTPTPTPTPTAQDVDAFDNRLKEESPDSVLSETTWIDIGRIVGNNYNGVLKYNLSQFNSTDIIEKATLSLLWYYESRDKSTDVGIYRPGSWDPEYVTWNSCTNGVSWNNLGGDWFDKNITAQGAEPYDSATFSIGTAPDEEYHDFNVTELVQSYVDGTYENTGFFIKADEANDGYIAFHSLDHSDVDQRPKLTIVHSPMAEDVNQSLVLDVIGNKSVNTLCLLEFTLIATDPDGDTLTYSSTGLPGGASFDTVTNTFSWIPKEGQEGSYQIHFKVTDGYTADTQDVSITVNYVNGAPEIESLSPGDGVVFTTIKLISNTDLYI